MLIGRRATLNHSSSQGGIKAALIDEAHSLGFDEVRIAEAHVADEVSKNFDAFIAGGHYGDMAWMADKADRRRAPKALWSEVQTVISVAVNYGSTADPLALLNQTDRGAVSVYARGRDYHDVLKKRLKRLARWLVEQCDDAEVKVFVDTAPVLEKPLAESAGLGWQGKHTNLVSRKYGSWLFLGEVFTTLSLPPDTPEQDHCGSCSKCLGVCPTDAFIDAYRLDARRCISYLTIEHKGHISAELRPLMGNRIYGCDDCLAVCPWNKFATVAEPKVLKSRSELEAPHLADLVQLDDADFRTMFSGSPIKRIGRDRFVRNVLIAIGNSDNSDLAQHVAPLSTDESPLVRAMAIWALSRISLSQAVDKREAEMDQESDADVRREWAAF